MVRGDDSQIERTRWEFHNMQISDHRCLGEVFKNLRTKLNLAEEAPVLDLKANVSIWGLFMLTTMKASVHLGPMGSIQEHWDSRSQEFVQHHAEIDLMYHRLTGQLRFGRILWEDVRAFLSEPKMECSTRRISSPILKENHLELMENRLSSSGILSQDLLHWKSSRRPKTTCKIKTLSLKILKDGSSSCQSTFNDIDSTRRGNSEKCISNSKQVKNYAKRVFARTLVTPRPRWGKGTVRNSQLHTWRKVGFHRHRDGVTFPRNWSPSIQGHQCFESWNSKKKRWQMYHTLRCGFIEHRTLCFAQIIQQISSVSTEQFQTGVKSSLNGLRIEKSRRRRSSRRKEMSSLWKMWSRKKWISGANSKERQSGIWKQIARMSSEIWNTGERFPIYKGLWRCDIREKSFYWDDGFGDRTSACRENTLPCEDPNSDILTSVDLKFRFLPQQRKIEPSWVGICRGKHRYVEEYHHNDPDLNPTSSELLEHIGLERSVAKEREPGSTEMEPSWSIEEAHAKQLKVQRNPCTIIQKKLFPLKKGSDMAFLPVNISEDAFLKPKSQKWSWDWCVVVINTKETQTPLFIGNQWVQNCQNHFTRLEGTNSRTLIGFSVFTKEATKLGSSITHWWERDSAWVDGCRYSIQMEGFSVSSRMLSWCHFNPQVKTHRWWTRKARKLDRPSSSHLSTVAGTIQMKKNLARTSRSPKKYTTTASGNLVRTPSTESI